MTHCVFCKIIKGEIPSSKVYEDKEVLAFLDIAPVSKGHTLVIPKRHFETIIDTPNELLGKVINAVKKLSPAVMKATGAEGISVAQSNYPAAGQVVPHLHFHIMPRFKEDGLRFWPKIQYEEGEINKVAEKIKKAL